VSKSTSIEARHITHVNTWHPDCGTHLVLRFRHHDGTWTSVAIPHGDLPVVVRMIENGIAALAERRRGVEPARAPPRPGVH
jgi:hypothetical protein